MYDAHDSCNTFEFASLFGVVAQSLVVMRLKALGKEEFGPSQVWVLWS